MIIPGCPCVRALNCLQNSMMFTPCCPSAGPTGGAGFAAPAGTWSLMKPVTFLAMSLSSSVVGRQSSVGVVSVRGWRPATGGRRLVTLQLRVVQLDAGGAAEEGDL